MLRKLLVVAAAATLSWSAIAQLQSSRLAHAQVATSPVVDVPCTELFANEPLVVYDVTGSTLAGPVHRHLAVYSSGAVSFVDIPFHPSNANALQVFVTPMEAQTLLADLADAGAFEACDGGFVIPSDLPLNTVTVFGQFRTTNTFSYYNAGEFAAVQDVIDAFIATHLAL